MKKKQTAIVTGGAGFIGSHMVDYLLENVKDVQVYAIRRWRSKDMVSNRSFKDKIMLL